MINIHHKTLFVATSLLLLLNLSGCSAANKVRGLIGDDSGVDYQKNKSIKLLEIPPDLTKPEFDRAFDLPTGIVSAVSLKNGTAMPQSKTSVAGNNVGAIRKGDLSSIRTVSGKTVLVVNDSYPRSLVLTEIMLTRMGFSTISKSPSGDVITAKYNGADVAVIESTSGGWLSGLKNIVTFGSERRKINANKALLSGKTYRIKILNENGLPVVSVVRADIVNISDAGHAKIISLLNNAFNK